MNKQNFINAINNSTSENDKLRTEVSKLKEYVNTLG